MADSAPFEAFEHLMLDTQHRRLAERVLEWSRRCSSDTDVAVQAPRTFFATTFGTLCAPIGASADEIEISIQFLMVFFLVDDADAPSVADMIDTSLGRPPRTAAGHAFLAYRSALMGHLDAQRPEVREFENTLRDFLRTVLIEKTADRQKWTLEEFLAIRKVVVGIPAFSDCWRAIRRITFDASTAAALHDSKILDVTCEIAGLVNDIASFDRDAEAARAGDPNADPNLVVFAMAEHGTRAAALDHAIAWYNRKVEEFARIERTLLDVRGGDASVRAYVGILHRAIVGDLATSKHLGSLRYEGSRASLQRLVLLDSLG